MSTIHELILGKFMNLSLVPISINDYLVLSFGDHHLSCVINYVPRKQQRIVDPIMDRTDVG